MLAKVDLFTPKTRKELESRIARLFPSPKPEEHSLHSVVEEALASRELFKVLSLHLNDTDGLPLDSYIYWDDASIEVEYGLAIRRRNGVKGTTLYHQMCIGDGLVDELTFSSPFYAKDINRTEISNYPTPENFRNTLSERVLELIQGKAKLCDLRILAIDVNSRIRERNPEAEELRRLYILEHPEDAEYIQSRTG